MSPASRGTPWCGIIVVIGSLILCIHVDCCPYIVRIFIVLRIIRECPKFPLPSPEQSFTSTSNTQKGHEWDVRLPSAPQNLPMAVCGRVPFPRGRIPRPVRIRRTPMSIDGGARTTKPSGASMTGLPRRVILSATIRQDPPRSAGGIRTAPPRVSCPFHLRRRSFQAPGSGKNRMLRRSTVQHLPTRMPGHNGGRRNPEPNSGGAKTPRPSSASKTGMPRKAILSAMILHGRLESVGGPAPSQDQKIRRARCRCSRATTPNKMARFPLTLILIGNYDGKI